MTNDELVKLLQKEVCEIVFVKRDGTERHMICTLRGDIIPYVSAVDMRESVRTNDYIPVYDVEESAWRAFKPSKLKSINSTKV